MTEQLEEWARFIDGLQAGDEVPPVILESWRRSEAAGVERGAAGLHRVPDADLRQRLDVNREWLEIARGHIEWLSKAIKHVQHVVYVTDRDGIVLHSVGVGSMRETFGLAPGGDWSEARMGTNGAGTAIVANKPVAVVGSQHFKEAFGDCTCTGAPIRSPDGAVIGALDISTSVADSAPERLFVVAHAAYAISRGLALRETQMRHGATEERLLAALSASDAGTFRWNPHGDRFLGFDASLKRLFGFGPDEPVESVADLMSRIPPGDHSRLIAAMDDARRGADVELEFRVLLADGSVRWLFERAKTVADSSGEQGVVVGACIDVTQRKQTEDALIDVNRRLAASEGRLVTALDAAALGVWEHDSVTGSVQGDARWAEILGIPSGSVLKMREVFALVHEDDRARIREQFRAEIEGAQSFQADHRVVRPDGAVRWVAVRGRAVASSSGGARFLGTMMDITEQQESRELLRQTLDREREVTAILDAIYSAAPIGLGFWDRELRFRRVNARLAEMNGATPEEHIGKRPDELLSGIEGLDGIMQQWEQVIETGVPVLNVEVRGRTRNDAAGERIWVEDFFPVRVGDQIIGLGAVVEDVTEHRRTEEALRERESHYRALFDSMEEGFFVVEAVTDESGRVADFEYLEANPSCCRQVGLDDMAGKTLRGVMREDAGLWVETFRRILETGEGVQLEHRLRGISRTVEVSAYRVEDDTRRRVGVIFSDVTERLNAEAALREADRAKDEFLAVLGHELRNPLAPLRSGLDLLKHADDNPSLVRRVRPMMDRQLSHLVRLVDDLLDVSRITRGSIELQSARLDLNAAIEAAVEQLLPTMRERQHRFIVELTDAPLPVEGDLERITEVVSNLLSNAAKYTAPGGTVRVISAREDSHAVVRVVDTGYGIPPERRGRLFKLFSQLPEHTARTGGGGLGIGLALCRQLIDLHGGSIDAQSPGLDQGSTFIVRLPLVDRPLQKTSGAGQAMPDLPPSRILVVDDNVDAAEGLRMLLELQGHEVRAVQDGVAALAEMAPFSPEVVLLDVDMPGMDGIEVARRIRASCDHDSVILLAVTGWGQSDDRRRTSEAGFDGHLTKPVEWRALATALQALAEAR